MTVTPYPMASEQAAGISSPISWWDPDTECTITISHPSLQRTLWLEYLDGAETSYRHHGVDTALARDEVSSGKDTALFFAAIDRSNRVVGGLRAHGPLSCADDSHAAIEWGGRPGERAVRRMIDDRAPFGVVEMKTAWVTQERSRSSALTRTLARTAVHTMTIVGSQFAMATSAAHVLQRWRTSGGEVVESIPATPYPDARYETRMMWWDRRTYARSAQPTQLGAILTERRHIERALSHAPTRFGTQRAAL